MVRYDPFSEELYADPFPIYRELRDLPPVEAQMSGKIVTSKSARDMTPYGIYSKRESMVSTASSLRWAAFLSQ